MVIAAGVYLIPGPFVDWLQRVSLQLQESSGGCGYSELAERLGLDESRVRRMADPSKKPKSETGLVKAITVDDWMTRLGGDARRLYGPLWELARITDYRASGERCVRCSEPLIEPAALCGFCIEEGVSA